MTESATNTITMVTLSKMLTGLESKQTMPVIRVAHYGTKEDLITKLAHLAEHMYEGEQQRSVLIMMGCRGPPSSTSQLQLSPR